MTDKLKSEDSAAKRWRESRIEPKDSAALPSPPHTPGPWNICSTTLTNRDFPTKHPHFEIGSANSMFWIAHVQCFSNKHIGSEYEANARLIAAAPDLLEALEWVSVWLECGEFRADHKEEGETIRNAIEAAIRKAKGETS